MATVVVVCSDLLFHPRVADQARRLGYEALAVDGERALAAALDAGAALAVLDLHAAGLDWERAVAAATARGVPVLAFGRHTDAQLLRRARELGCTRVVPRSALVDELPALIAELAGDPAILPTE